MTTDDPDHYAVLEIAPGARQEVVEAAWRQLAKAYHPDLHPGNAAAEPRLKLINAAYHVLNNPVRRADYDLQRQSGKADAGEAWSTKDDADDLPVLVIEPETVELWPSRDADYIQFSIRVRQVAGPAWHSGRHVLDVKFDDPWRRSMFTKVRSTGTAPPLDIHFEMKLSDLSPKQRLAGAIRVEANVVTTE